MRGSGGALNEARVQFAGGGHAFSQFDAGNPLGSGDVEGAGHSGPVQKSANGGSDGFGVHRSAPFIFVEPHGFA